MKKDQANSEPVKATSVRSVPNAGTAATKLCQLVFDGDLDPKEIHPARSHLEGGGFRDGWDDVT